MHFLKIFGWFLLTFGVVCFIATLAGVNLGIGPRQPSLFLFALQALIGASVGWMVRLNTQGKLAKTQCLAGGWGLIVAYCVFGQWWLNVG